MRLSAHWRQMKTASQIVVAGTDKPRLLLQTFDDGLLHFTREATAGAEVHQTEVAEIEVGGELRKISQLVFEGFQR